MKWSGTIGFNEVVETEPGIFDPKVVPHKYFGDIIQPSWREQQGDKINKDLQVTNKISVVADQNLLQGFHKIAYVTFGGAKWTVSNVNVEERRIVLSLGPLYLEEE